MLNVLYMVDIDIGIVVTIIITLCDIVAIKKDKKNYFSITLFSLILLFAVSSVVTHVFYTKTPDLYNYTLDEAHHSLSESDLVLNDTAEQIAKENLGSSNFRVQTQEPEGGEIVRKNSVVTVTFKEIPDSPEATAPPIQGPEDTYTSPISTPTQGITDPTPSTPQPTPKPTPTPSTSTPKPTPNSNSTSNGSTGTENGTDTGEYQPAKTPISDYNTNNPYSDPAFNGNAGVGGGINSDVGPGDYQPEAP